MSASDQRHCQQIVRHHARTFWMASQLLPRVKRRAAFALYAFCRVADDLVDEARDAEPAAIMASLRELRRRLDGALGGNPDDALLREVARASAQYGIPPRLLHELLDGVAIDCRPVRFASWTELESYCQGVASSVGEMCAYVFGVEGGAWQREAATTHARNLGVAMQLTNILRDVGEDAQRRRCYLPEAELARFGLAHDEVISGTVGRDARWRSLMDFQIHRARSLYDASSRGIALLAPDARRCATACASGYAAILDAIEALDYDVFHARAHLGPLARAAILWNAWRVPLTSSPVAASCRGTSDHDLAATS